MRRPASFCVHLPVVADDAQRAISEASDIDANHLRGGVLLAERDRSISVDQDVEAVAETP